MRKYLLLITGILLLAYWTFMLFYKQHQLSNLHYGIKANALRVRLHVPIIDDYLKVESKYDATSGHRWKAEKEFPSDKEILHVWKMVTPFSDTAGLYKEMDGFRNKYKDSLYYQLNIYSEITGDTSAQREMVNFSSTIKRSCLTLSLVTSKMIVWQKVGGFIN